MRKGKVCGGMFTGERYVRLQTRDDLCDMKVTRDILRCVQCTVTCQCLSVIIGAIVISSFYTGSWPYHGVYLTGYSFINDRNIWSDNTTSQYNN